MIANEYFERFQDDTVDKQIRIEFDGGVITNEDFNGQSFELTESLCSESALRFGSCEASTIKIKVHNIFIPLKGKWLTVSTMLKGMEEPFLIGRYKVYSDIPTADRKYRDVVAYDAMYDIINADVSDWYNEVLPDKEEDTWITMRSFRTSLMRHFGIEQEETELVNDYMKVERTIEPEQMSGRDVITAICEMNGCFGHIGRNGKFQWICLPQAIQGLYPANELYPDHAPDHLPYQQRTGHLYPQEPQGTKIGKGFYIECGYEDFVTKDINKVQIRQEENDIGCIYPNAEPNEDDNCYIIEDNFLVYGKTASALETIAAKIYGKVSNISYRPVKSIDAKGNPCFEVGDPIRLVTKYEIIESYILKRTLKGIQALRDNYSADGELEYSEKVNSVQKSIVQLKGKSNVLERTIEETRLEMADIEAGLKTEISVTADGLQSNITKEQKRAEGEETKLSNSIKVTADGLSTEIARAEGAEKGLQQDYIAKITASAKELGSEITEKTQTWDTGNYAISYSGNGFPAIEVDAEKYYLDKQSGAIYKGIGKTEDSYKEYWADLASYDYNTKREQYEIFRDESGSYGYTIPRIITESELEDYDYGESVPAEGGNPRDVFLEITWQDVLDYWVYHGELIEGKDAYWEKVGQARKMDFPEMASKIIQNSNEIKLTVKKGDLSSEISQEAGKISIRGDRISIASQKFNLTDDGEVTCTGATVSGTITSTGTNGNTKVTNGGFYIYNKNNEVAGCFYGSTGGRLDIYSSPGDTENLAFCASAMKTDIYAGGLRVHQNGVVVDGGGLTVNGDASVSGTLVVRGSKSRIIGTADYGTVAQYCYEMASPVFGDMGTGKTDGAGFCYIYFDPVFAETASTAVEYCVFLQKEGEGDIWISKKAADFFLVRGTPGLPFAWEAKVKQTGYEYTRLENYTSLKDAGQTDYEALWDNTRTTDYVELWDIYSENYEKNL